MDVKKIVAFGLTPEHAVSLSKKINDFISALPAEQAWSIISKKVLSSQEPYELHRYIFETIFPHWLTNPETAPVWSPDTTFGTQTNMARFMDELNIHKRENFHHWSITYPETFWAMVIEKLAIVFQKNPTKISSISSDVEKPQWLVDAKLNITDSCFNAAPDKIAIIYQDEKTFTPQQVTYGELDQWSNDIAASLLHLKFKPNDRIAINMPMTKEAVAIYLGIIKMGAVVVSIADSFSSDEIATRLRITKTNAVFTQETIFRNGKTLPLYEKVVHADAPRTIVLSDNNSHCQLRNGDLTWHEFLITDQAKISHVGDPLSHCNILFSSGTTGDPKAIPWTPVTVIKAASDAYLHHNIKPDDILAWPTNLGWMMGPWLLFASLINQATLAIYDGVPTDRAFGKFIQDAKVTMLGVVPTLVGHWRQTNCMKGLDWQAIRLFSSTGECSNPEDMFYLMYLAGYKPIIEYCGGTEIGGSYVTSTLIEKNYLSLFTTPTMGLDFTIIDEEGKPSHLGEVALIPPAFGLSTELINADHHKIYYEGMPRLSGKILRRHGDQIKQYANGLYCVLGRSDDTMNLGAIKVSSAEIERVLVGIDHINETAAIAISPTQGPSVLVIYAATTADLNKEDIKKQMQKKINQQLNPLFKIHEVVFTKELPKTASNKIMRRILRTRYPTTFN